MTYRSWWFRLAVVVGALLVPGCASVNPGVNAYCRVGTQVVPEEPNYRAYEACMAQPGAVDSLAPMQYEFFEFLQWRPIAERLLPAHA